MPEQAERFIQASLRGKVVVLFGPMPRSHTVIWLIALFWQQLGVDVLKRPENKSTES